MNRQQEKIDKLEEHADSNKITDLFQWLSILFVAIGILMYISIGLVGVLKSQAESIRTISENCGRDIRVQP